MLTQLIVYIVLGFTGLMLFDFISGLFQLWDAAVLNTKVVRLKITPDPLVNPMPKRRRGRPKKVA
ncbi:hypothetical protein [Fischerella sp. PCC 9605]|uniref:hypothetical protein n=1 Tax=Fischerella sp. PCC 9605 TaxID=1173024 RepID=UPI0004799349